MKITHELVRAFLIAIRTGKFKISNISYYTPNLIRQMLLYDYESFNINSEVADILFKHFEYNGNNKQGWYIKIDDLTQFNRQRNIDNFLKYTK